MQVVYEDRSLTVPTLPLPHRVPCCGYLFKEKPGLPHIRRDMIDFYKIPISQIFNIKGGADGVTPEGDVVPNSRLVTPADPVRSFAYCSDTAYLPQLHEMIRGVNLLYHESTYGNEYEPQALRYHHSTAAQAAMVARDAGAVQLMLGHYSARYNDETCLLEEARAIFPNTILSNEGLEVSVSVKNI
jgi:ribonuclease Z